VLRGSRCDLTPPSRGLKLTFHCSAPRSPSADSNITLGTLSVTCRATVEPANRQPYRFPLRYARGYLNWSQAVLLHRTLKAVPRLAGYVRNLSTLGNTTSRLASSKKWLSTAVSTGFGPERWHDALISLCPNLRDVSLHIENSERAGEVATVIAGKSKLECMRLEMAGGAVTFFGRRCWFPRPRRSRASLGDLEPTGVCLA
jgi:hypothetical protein